MKEGHWYPPEARAAKARLEFYASRFPLVEVDSTYYFPPSEKNSVLWIERTPADFTFNIKAYSLLTNHPTRTESLYKDLAAELPEETLAKRRIYRDKLPDEVVDEVWQRFRDALMPLHSAGKLGAVLFQFPQWFVISRKNKAYIEECAERLPDFRVAVEFRHKSWMREEATSRRRWASSRSAASPTSASTCRRGSTRACHRSPRRPPTTSRWCASTAGTRTPGSRRPRPRASGSDTTTPKNELAEWVPKVQGLSGQVRETHVLMNNCYRDFAVRNARELGDMLDLDLPTERRRGPTGTRQRKGSLAGCAGSPAKGGHPGQAACSTGPRGWGQVAGRAQQLGIPPRREDPRGRYLGELAHVPPHIRAVGVEPFGLPHRIERARPTRVGARARRPCQPRSCSPDRRRRASA